MKKKVTSPIFMFLFLFSCSVFAQSEFNLGTVATVLDGITATNARTSSAYSFKTSSGALINTTIEHYYFENGQLSISGKATAAKSSLLILKGTTTSLYGYLAIHDSQKAYEYTTVNGQVIVKEVPIAKLFPDQYEEEFPRPLSIQSGPIVSPLAQFDYSPMALHQAPHIGPYQNQDVRKLQSKPDSKKVFYLDITTVMNGDTPQTNTKEDMFRMWECVSDQYSMYDLNVTTDPAVYSSVPVTSSGVMKFNPGGDRPSAPLHVFGTKTPGTMFIDYTPSSKPHYAAAGRTCAHETGHVMGMNHDHGGTGGEYFEGIAAFEWCPIMGNYWMGDSWKDGLFQWSKGEYTSATNFEDDLAIMIGDALAYRTDDIPTTKNLVITAGSTIAPDANFGQIERTTDSDIWTFRLGDNGHLKLKLDPLECLGMLDIDARLLDGTGKEIAKSNLPVNRSATFDLDLKPDNYQLVIKGGAEGTPQNGFSNYSSLGFYGMQGTLTGSSGIDKTVLDNSITIYPNPAAEIAYLRIPTEAKVLRISLTSIVGQVVFETRENINSINLSAFTKGVYVLKIEANGESITRKITKL